MNRCDRGASHGPRFDGKRFQPEDGGTSRPCRRLLREPAKVWPARSISYPSMRRRFCALGDYQRLLLRQSLVTRRRLRSPATRLGLAR